MALRSLSFSSRTFRASAGNSVSHAKRSETTWSIVRSLHLVCRIPGQHAFITQSLFQPNDAVLHRQCKHSCVKRQNHECHGEHDAKYSSERKLQLLQPKQRPNKVGHEYRQYKKMECWDKPRVICKILFVHFSSSRVPLIVANLWTSPRYSSTHFQVRRL